MKKINKLKLKNNFNLKFVGEPTLSLKKVDSKNIVGICPLAYNFLKAKLVVKVGDHVKQGDALFYDKKNPQVYFHSPVSGEIKNITYGPQRRLDLIEIKQTNETPRQFNPIQQEKTDSIELKSALLERGLWNGFIELPFYNVPDPSKTPPAIVIPLSHSEPFQPKHAE